MNISPRTIIATATLALLTLPAQAAGLRCKSDPTVLLSNGTVLDLSADIGAPLWNVTSVEYVIHVPAGLRIIAVFSTPDWPTAKEKFTLVTDNPVGRYSSVTTVCTCSCTDVTAQLVVNTQIQWRSGTSGQKLPTTISSSSLL